MGRWSWWQRAAWVLAAALLASTIASCREWSDTRTGRGSTPNSSPATPAEHGGQRLVVFAASSLFEPFQELGKSFQSAHGGTTVEFNFAGSAQLVAQLQQGASADVIAFADLPNMKKAQDAGLVAGEPVIFAKNRLTVVVPRQNTARIQHLADLARPGVKVVLAHENVPVGRYAREMLERASQRPGYGADFAQRVLANVVSQEINVKQVLAKVALGEADAGIVYVTDVKAAGADVQEIEIPDDVNVVACYPIAVTKSSRVPALAQEFVALVQSEEGQAVLEQYGFQTVQPEQTGMEDCS